MIIVMLLSMCISFFLLYMHDLDTLPAFLIPFATMFMSTESAIYFSIISVIGISMHKLNRVPRFLFLISYFPVMFDSRAILTGVVYLLLIAPLYVGFIYFKEERNIREIVFDLQMFFSIGIYFRNLDYFGSFFVLNIFMMLAYFLLAKRVKVIVPAVVSAYLVELLFKV